MRCTAFYRRYLPVWLLQVWFTVVYSGQVNVALNKKYSQSTFRSFDDRRPENAANDNTDGTFSDNNCIRTSSSDDNPWWQVDLGQVYPVLKLTIYGCSGYESHLESSTITVDGRECVRITSMPSRAINISCSSTLYGRFIRISKCPVKNLMMCEFQVWVCEDGTYGAHCLQRCGQCKHNVTCHHINGTCSQGCAPGWTGNMCNQIRRDAVSSEAVSGIVVGVCVCTSAAIVVVVCLCRKKKQSQDAPRHKEDNTNQDTRLQEQKDLMASCSPEKEETDRNS